MFAALKRVFGRKKPSVIEARGSVPPRRNSPPRSHLEPVSRPTRSAFVASPRVVVVEEERILDPLSVMSPMSPFYTSGLGLGYEAAPIIPPLEPAYVVDPAPAVCYDSGPSYDPSPPSFDCGSSSYDSSSSIDYGSSSGGSDWS